MRWLILDEADKLFDMGFTQQVGCASVVSALQIVQLLRGNSAWMGAHGTCMGGWGDCTASSRMFIRLTGCWLVPRGALPQSAAAAAAALLARRSADGYCVCGLHPHFCCTPHFCCSFGLQIDTVLAACTHKDIVRGLFSATLPEQVRLAGGCRCRVAWQDG